MKLYNGDIMEVLDENFSINQNADFVTVHSQHCTRVASSVDLVKVSKHRYAIKDSVNSNRDLILRKLLIITEGVINDKSNGLGLYVDKDSLKEVATVKLSKTNK